MMPDGDLQRDASLFPQRPGERLRSARIAQGLDIAEIAARTRIPQRHLEAIEDGIYTGLPSTTYAMGFAKGYARAIGIDEAAIGRDVRAELSKSYERTVTTPVYEIDDPARTPSGALMWGGILVAVLIVLFAGLYFGTSLFRGSGSGPSALVTVPAGEPAVAPVAAPPVQAPPPTGGQVTLTARDDVWMRVTDARGERLIDHTLKAGEKFDVPPGADRPVINVGRPDEVTVTINGSVVPPLSDRDLPIRNVPVSAAALLARAPAPAATASPPAP